MTSCFTIYLMPQAPALTDDGTVYRESLRVCCRYPCTLVHISAALCCQSQERCHAIGPLQSLVA